MGTDFKARQGWHICRKRAFKKFQAPSATSEWRIDNGGHQVIREKWYPLRPAPPDENFFFALEGAYGNAGGRRAADPAGDRVIAQLGGVCEGERGGSGLRRFPVHVWVHQGHRAQGGGLSGLLAAGGPGPALRRDAGDVVPTWRKVFSARGRGTRRGGGCLVCADDADGAEA